MFVLGSAQMPNGRYIAAFESGARSVSLLSDTAQAAQVFGHMGPGMCFARSIVDAALRVVAVVAVVVVVVTLSSSSFVVVRRCRRSLLLLLLLLLLSLPPPPSSSSSECTSRFKISTSKVVAGGYISRSWFPWLANHPCKPPSLAPYSIWKFVPLSRCCDDEVHRKTPNRRRGVSEAWKVSV